MKPGEQRRLDMTRLEARHASVNERGRPLDRDRYGASQQEIAEQLGVTRQRVQQIEREALRRLWRAALLQERRP